jgi:hypothetical protein
MNVDTGTETDKAVFDRMLDAFEKSETNKSGILLSHVARRVARLAAAAVLVMAFLVVAKMFVHAARKPGSAEVEETLVPGSAYAQIAEVRQMAAARDVAGLVSMLSEGRFETKLVAANFLTKMGNLPALEALSMHASGNLIIEGKEGKLLLRSASGGDWIELNGSTLLVHSNQAVQSATEMRITHDVVGNEEEWCKRQREFRGPREQRVALEEKLSQPLPVVPEDVNQLRDRVARVSEFLDGIDEAIYITVDGGRLILDSPFRGRQAWAELADGVVRVESHGHIVEANSVTLLLGLRPVPSDGPPLPTPSWRERFGEVYSLADYEVLRWVRTPFIPERQIYASIQSYHGSDNPPPPDYIFFLWDDDDGLRWWAVAMSQCPLASVLTDILRTAGLKDYEVRGPDSLRFLALEGDWIVRDGVTIDDKLRALKALLNDELNIGIRFERDETEQVVWLISERANDQ